MGTFYKAVRPDGTDFYSGSVQWAPLDGVYPHHVQHPDSGKIEFDLVGPPDFSTCLSVSSEKTDCIGFEWPARLLAVEAPDAVHAQKNKFVCLSATVVAELPAHEVFGPQGEHVVQLLDALEKMTPEQVETIARVGCLRRYPGSDVIWDAVRAASRYAAWDAAGEAACHAVSGPIRYDDDDDVCSAADIVWAAAQDAVTALVGRDLVSRQHYDAATRPIREAGFTVHPDDRTLV